MRTLVAILVLIGATAAQAAAPTTQPAGEAGLCPPGWQSALLYYQSFDGPEGKAEVVAGEVRVLGNLLPQAGGFQRRGGAPVGADGKKPASLRLESARFSPHLPLTVSFWWAPAEDVPAQGGLNLLNLGGGRGYIGHFGRGGPWCGLTQTAGVVQVYNLPGVANVNAIYDPKLHQSLGLTRGGWHHTAMVCSGASLVSVFTDGKLVFDTRAQGRAFRAEDGFKQLTLGGGVWLDEVAILSRPLGAEEIAEYGTALRQMREAYGAR